jgi:hypothetical protein
MVAGPMAHRDDGCEQREELVGLLNSMIRL